MAPLAFSIQGLKNQILQVHLVMKMTLILPRGLQFLGVFGLGSAQWSWRLLCASPGEHI